MIIMKKILIKVLTLIIALSTVFALTFAVGCGEDEGDEGGTGGPETGVWDDGSSSIKLQLNASQLQLVIGDEATLTSNTSQIKSQNLTFVSDNTNVATVASNGKITALNEGVANVTASWQNYSATCKVNVGFGTSLPNLYIKNEPLSKTYDVGVTRSYLFEPYVLFNGLEFYDADVEYFSSDESIAEFSDETPGKLIAKSKGTTTVSFKATWRGKNFESAPSLFTNATVNVVDYYEFYVGGNVATNLELCTTENFEGNVYVKELALAPEFWFNGVKEGEGVEQVQVVSSDDDVVTINGGMLVAKSFGVAQITLSFTHNGEPYSKVIDVNVTRPVAEYSGYADGESAIDYFSALAGTVKVPTGQTDKSGIALYENKTLNQVLWGDEAEDIYDVYQIVDGEQKLIYKDGKHELPRDTDNPNNADYEAYRNRIFDIDVPNDKIGDVRLLIGTRSQSYYVNLKGYGAVITEQADFASFNVKLIYEDTVHTEANGYTVEDDLHIDDRYPVFYGYSVMLNDVVYGNYNKHPHRLRKVAKKKATNTGDLRLMYQGYTFGLAGTFDGQGHTLKTVYSGYHGLFVRASGGAVIKNVYVTDIYANDAYTMFFYGADSLGSQKGKFSAGRLTFKDCYFESRANLTTPSGLISKNLGDALAIENCIFDLSNVNAPQGLTQGGTIFNGLNGLHKRKAERIYTKDVYVISTMPVGFKGNQRIYGENECPSGYNLETEYEEGAYKVSYATGIKRYNSIEEMQADKNNDYSSFVGRDAWFVGNIPYWSSVALNNDVVVPYVNGELAIGNIASLNAGITHSIELKKLNTQTPLTNVVFESKEEDKISINTSGIITTNSVTTETTVEVIAYYNEGDGQKFIILNVKLVPFMVVCDEEIVISSLDGSNNIKDVLGYTVFGTDVTQTVEGDDKVYELVGMTGGNIAGGKVAIKEDRSDVKTSTVRVVQEDGKVYTFTNAKVYSHIIDEYQDLEVFTLTELGEVKNGFYIMTKDIDSEQYVGASIPNGTLSVTEHNVELFKADNGKDVAHNHTYVTGQYPALPNENGYFNGVFDGRGHSISNFIPDQHGLFGILGADNTGAATIKNVAFINANFAFQMTYSDAPLFAYQAMTGDKDNRIIIENVHVSILQKASVSPGFPRYQGLIGYVGGNANVKLKNVYVENQAFKELGYLGPWKKPLGMLFSKDDVVGSQNGEFSLSDSRFENVISLSTCSLVYYRCYSDVKGDKFYNAYGENMLGKVGMIVDSPSNKNGAPADDPIIDGGKGSGCYLYKGTKQFLNIEEFRTAIGDNSIKTNIDAFLATGLWELRTETVGEKQVTDLVWKGSTNA